MTAWLRAFLFTQIVEVPIDMRGLRCSVIAALGASTLTHPVVWFVFFSPRWHAGYTARFVAAELFAWLAEAAYFKLVIKKDRALLWSLLANAANVAVGMLSRRLFGLP